MIWKKLVLTIAPAALMIAMLWGLTGIETWLASLGTSRSAYLFLGKVGLALPYATAGGIGLIFLFAAAGSASIRSAGLSALLGGMIVVVTAVINESGRLLSFADRVAEGTLLSYADPFAFGGAMVALGAGIFALRVTLLGNAAFVSPAPKRIPGKRSIHGDADWMRLTEAAKLFPAGGGIVVGERYRVDRDTVAPRSFKASDHDSWGSGGRKPLLGFAGNFGSGHAIVFAGSGGFKTTSVTIPTTLQWRSGLVVLDPSNEVAPMVTAHRKSLNRQVYVIDPGSDGTGFNALDWIGRFGGTKEEDIAAVASWIMTDNPRVDASRNDFFRGSAQQLVTALIADVCLSGHTPTGNQTLRQVRTNLAEPEPKLRTRLQEIYDSSQSAFVRENVAPFINMTPETFSGIYGAASKETHWLSYENYAALVSGRSFATDEVAVGNTDIFINLDLKTLENHPGLARVIIGSLMNAIYNRNGDVEDRTLFLLDEVARLGYMRILETARDAGRKYGISLLMLFQSIGQMREAYGGRDASSKWFESASWTSFAAINDPETAEYISKRCGDTTVEVDQTSTSSRMNGTSRTRSKQLARRPLILPHEVMQMRTDEQIVFTAGNPPLRCGRAIYFRRKEMIATAGANRFGPKRK
ncbi:MULTISPECIES: Ti-type conjugative transfer system protein TraG [unclassified Mesorhizobium]|uniref:Ti-type conjugative transfer system protein TraG n=1 Tax=unclassified Mesorhizobium TaxID=325217 RepID=UPI0011278349|nr:MULTISPECIES: Ti-type conjugative transfer system protein TraG [unclassified Mesorhizobium]MBZ9985218.1 Ti-type conjugative transfer system protein TraG [Mesorhizobium sp. BR-1-1-8]TPL26861.1 Ti-type conjugative transfer system protein TraG [Mesorhizobium sp. B2-4-8]TPL58089.1 Ti-type conjugative transfer system protein TraG [Mesorhizobium sp. B2-4-1]